MTGLMSLRSSVPLSTRSWGLLALLALAACVWALAWPAVEIAPEAGDSGLPGYPDVVAPSAAAPNPGDPAWMHPLFFSDRRPRVARVDGEQAGAVSDAGFAATLTGIVHAPGMSLAVLNTGQGGRSVRVRPGQEVEGMPGWRLVSLGRHSARFRDAGGQEAEVQLNLRGGNSASQPPSNATSAAATPPANAERAADASPVPDQANPAPPEAQIDAIRRRIQARRAQMANDAGADQGDSRPPSPSPTPPIR